MKNWQSQESYLTDRRNKLCMQGASREESLAAYGEDQQRNNRRYDGLMKNKRRTAASFK